MNWSAHIEEYLFVCKLWYPYCVQIIENGDCQFSTQHTWSVRKVSDRIFLCEHLMDYNLARLHEPTLNLSAHA